MYWDVREIDTSQFVKIVETQVHIRHLWYWATVTGWKLVGCGAYGTTIDGSKGECVVAEWNIFLWQFPFPELYLGGDLDVLTLLPTSTFGFVILFLIFSQNFIKSDMSFDFLPLCLTWSLPPITTWYSDLDISNLFSSAPVWLMWEMGLTGLGDRSGRLSQHSGTNRFMD
jgi:hypothetical protein